MPLLLASGVRDQVGRTRVQYGENGEMTDVYSYHLNTIMTAEGRR